MQLKISVGLLSLFLGLRMALIPEIPSTQHNLNERQFATLVLFEVNLFCLQGSAEL